ncbi:MAG: hypothetical protein HYX92_21610 [Chloroflexi bacterium]|nr:hypothetical protein [Chloroflexota bacterium]
MYSALSPLGEPTIEKASAAPRISDLSGKTVCEVWNGVFRGDITFPIIRELLQKRYPGVKVIPYTEFPIPDNRGTTAELLRRVDAIVAQAIQRGCDAMIVGNGF